ncbi:MAG: protein-tyrosine kinase [Lachnospiraceae bacterium]|nr:protein-tyrosine kinase [Lachnospiraceae bacterium]
MKNEEMEIDLQEILYELLGNLHILILATLIGALGMFYASSELMDKKFQSSTSLYVIKQQDDQTVTYSDLQTGSQLTKDYAQLIVSRKVTSQVIADLDLQNTYPDMIDITSDDLAKMITVTTQQDTRILKITVTDTDPVRAQDIADAVREVAAERIYSVMDIESVNVVDYANLPESPVSPNKMKNVLIGGILGFLIAAVIIVVLHLMDDTIVSVDDVQKYLEISVLASIPFYDGEKTSAKKKRSKAKQKA